MKTITDPAFRKKILVRLLLGTSLLAVLPHLARSYDINDGMRIGIQASTNAAVHNSSVTIGSYNYGSGPACLAVGSGNNLYNYGNQGSIAVGSYNYLSGYGGFVFGYNNSNSATFSMLTGQGNSVGASYSFGYGYGNQIPSSAANAMAGGSYNIAEGQNSVALGRFVTAKTYASMVVGQYNATAASENDAAAKSTWRPTDPLFVVGNGTATNNKKNALVITKDGTVTINKVPDRGGISMGSYTAP